MCARVCVCVRVRGQRWPPAGASCSRARVRSSQALARSYPPTHLREASTRSRESQKGVRLRAHAPTDLGTQSAGPTQRAIIAADAAGPAALQSHRTGTVNGVPCGHAPAGRAGWSVCGKRASRGNLAIVRRPVGAAKMSGEKISSKKALWMRRHAGSARGATCARPSSTSSSQTHAISGQTSVLEEIDRGNRSTPLVLKGRIEAWPARAWTPSSLAQGPLGGVRTVFRFARKSSTGIVREGDCHYQAQIPQKVPS